MKNKIHFRENTTDLNCLNEVLVQKVYHHKKFGFSIDKGEHWLDCGGNIGAFGLFCEQQGASCESYEPMKDNFDLMKKNYAHNKKLTCHNFSITNSFESSLKIYSGNKPTDMYRFTTKSKAEKFFVGEIENQHADIFKGRKFDGVKIDIEASEFGLLDDRLIPECNKLVMEYHISKDKDFNNFDRRMNYLREIFDEVYYMKSLDMFDRNTKYPGAFDRIIYCKNN